MSIWTKLFSANKVIDGVISAGDKLVFTPEEKKELFIEELKVYTPFKIAQRWLMITVCVPYVIMALVLFGCLMTDIGNTDSAIDVLTGPLGWAFVAIVGFYTGGGAIEGGIKAWGKK